MSQKPWQKVEGHKKSLVLLFSLFTLLGKFYFFPLNLALASDQSKFYSNPEKWQQDEGDSILFKDFRGKEVILTMSYTQCRKICPAVTFEKLKEIQKLYDLNHRKAEFVIITLDPKNDTPKVLNDFRNDHGYNLANWHFLNGSEASTKELSDWMGIGAVNYGDHILHGFKIMRIDGQGEIRHQLNFQNQNVKNFLNP